MADADSTPCCTHCGQRIVPRINKTTGLPSKVVRRFCGNRCMWAARDAARGPRRYRPPAIRTIACHGCGITSDRPMRKDEAGRYCSRRCNTDAVARLAAERAALVRIRQAWAWRPSPLVVAETAALRRIARRVVRRMRGVTACLGCGTAMAWVRKKGGCQRVCDACLAQRRKANRAQWRQTDKGRQAKRIAKHQRRAVTRGVDADRIDPIAVFDRDKWTCQLCGKRTPKRLRGTIEALAPELDHIIPLALGGGHTWANVQCACRECNGKKGATVKGQLGLPFAA